MDEAEKMKATIASAEKENTTVKAQVQHQLANLDAKTVAVQEQLKSIEADRGTLASAIDEDLLDTYDRLFASKGDNAVVALEHEVCMGCHMKLTTQTAVRVKGRREVVHCEQCGRILYWSEG